ncbi:hypothetical protein EIB75_10580 [Epilithonimonas vandammei]|uniref:Uncharacterized protein n=1 Tax=Epilithonimonas vandammei TaxID=2487072 RepID=A0A3G8ZER5_9FLAO|nr:hypothetical protein [Epilithonimonas vandammei]AZI53912.1 hypothetical protein EIB75_00960 [Epilithonimonas vandammei]AZI55668.1 hypothetical protein EIB75_10580 [Epilithonimonas vandammei]
MWFNTDFQKLVKLHLPTTMRTAEMQQWVQSLTAPIIYLNNDFLEFRNNNLYILQHNSQVCYMRGVLNDKFDPQQRRIYIDDGDLHTRQYIYTDGEKKPKYLGTMYLYDDAEYEDTGVDFVVWIPENLEYDDFEMRAQIDRYRLASKRYKIKKFAG